MADNSTNATGEEEALSCDLIGLPSFLLQIVLGLVAFSTLFCEYN